MAGTIDAMRHFDNSVIEATYVGKTVTSCKDLLSRDLADRRDGRVLDLALDGDREEPLPDVLRAPHELEPIPLAELLRHHVGRREHTEPLLAQDRRQRDVIELRDHLRPNSTRLKPFVERAPERRVAARQ